MLVRGTDGLYKCGHRKDYGHKIKKQKKKNLEDMWCVFKRDLVAQGKEINLI